MWYICQDMSGEWEQPGDPSQLDESEGSECRRTPPGARSRNFTAADDDHNSLTSVDSATPYAEMGASTSRIRPSFASNGASRRAVGVSGLHRQYVDEDRCAGDWLRRRFARLVLSFTSRAFYAVLWCNGVVESGAHRTRVGKRRSRVALRVRPLARFIPTWVSTFA